MPVIGCLEIFQNGRSPQPITGIIYSPKHHHHHDSTNHSHNLFSHITLLANEMILSQHLKMVPRRLYSARLEREGKCPNEIKLSFSARS